MVDVVAPDLPSLLAQDRRTHSSPTSTCTCTCAGPAIERADLSLQDRLLQILIDPNLIVLLFLGGLAGIAFELTHPGIVLPGLLGGVSASCWRCSGSRSSRSRGPASPSSLFGLVLLAAEAHVPTHGAFAVVGVLALGLGGIILFRVERLALRRLAALS